MEICKDDFYIIFKENFPYTHIDTPIGTAIQMDPQNAFIYSCVTGSSYLANSCYPFNLLGLFKIFNIVYSYSFVTGIYENNKLKYSPYNLCQLNPYLNTGVKYIIAIEFESQIQLREKLNEYIKILEDSNLNPCNFIIQRINKSKKGNELEPLMEYFAAEMFKKKGYIVENQLPLSHGNGSPDLGVFSINVTQDILAKSKIISTGFHIFELSMLRSFKKHYADSINSAKFKSADNKSFVCEAKTSTTQMKKQLDKYIATGLFQKAYEIHPSKSSSSADYLGLISISKEYKLIFSDPINENKIDEEEYKQYFIWLNQTIKYYLLANLSNDELTVFLKMYNYDSREKIQDTINIIDLENIIKYIKQII